eukprot:2420785-Pyramimonas_sp.AAC.1
MPTRGGRLCESVKESYDAKAGDVARFDSSGGVVGKMLEGISIHALRGDRGGCLEGGLGPVQRGERFCWYW